MNPYFTSLLDPLFVVEMAEKGVSTAIFASTRSLWSLSARIYLTAVIVVATNGGILNAILALLVSIV